MKLHTFLSVALENEEWSVSLSVFYLHWENILYTFCRRLSGYQKRCDRGDSENIPDSTENRTPVIQPAASHLAANGEVGGRPGDTPAENLQLRHFLLAITLRGNRFLVDENSFCYTSFNKFGNWRSTHSRTPNKRGLYISESYASASSICWSQWRMRALTLFHCRLSQMKIH